MEFFLQLMSMVYNMFNIPMNVYGFEFSLWQVMMFSIVVALVFGFVGKVFRDD